MSDSTRPQRVRLANALIEVTHGVGERWTQFPVLGATREGIALARESVGKAPGRYKLVEPNTIFYNPMRILIGSIAFLDEGQTSGITSPDYVVFRTRPGVLHPKWFYYWLRSSDGAHFIRTLARGAVRERLLFRRLATGEILAPSFEAQRRFAEMISTVERARAAAEARLEATARLALAFLREAFGSRAIQKWPRRRVGEIGDSARGEAVQTGPFGAQLPSAEFVREGVPVLNVGNVQWGALDLSRLDHVAPAKAEALSRYRIQAGDLLFTRSGSVGRCAAVPAAADGWLISYHLLRVALDRRVADSEYLVAAIRGAREVEDQISIGARRGATRDGVNSSFLSALEVPLPDLSTQIRVVAELRSRMEQAKGLQEGARVELAAVRGLPAALLRRAFRGEL